jgi:hypothetical protein
MKSGFSLTQKFIPEWNDNKKASEPLVATLKMPTVQDLFTILERFQANGVDGKADSADVGLKRATSLALQAGEYLPKYVTLDNAEDFNINDVISFPPYFVLATELLFALVKFAQPDEADEKN